MNDVGDVQANVVFLEEEKNVKKKRFYYLDPIYMAYIGALFPWRIPNWISKVKFLGGRVIKLLFYYCGLIFGVCQMLRKVWTKLVLMFGTCRNNELIIFF